MSFKLICQNGVIEDVLGLEDTFEVLGLASKHTSPRKCPVLGSRTALFFDSWKTEITIGNFTLISVSSWMTFFFFGDCPKFRDKCAVPPRWPFFFETTCKIVSLVLGLGFCFESLALASNVGSWTPFLVNWVSSQIQWLVCSKYSVPIFPILL